LIKYLIGLLSYIYSVNRDFRYQPTKVYTERGREIRKEKANKQADKIKNCYPSGLGYLFLAIVRRE
jgi:hypothetical protein